MKHSLFILPFILLLTACAGIPSHAEPPRVSITGIQVQEAQLLEQQYLLTLNIQNPNETALYIKGLSYTLDINSREFAHGVSNHPLDIPAFSQGKLQVTLSSSTLGLVQQLQHLGKKTDKELNYRLRGKISLGTTDLMAHIFPIPFETTGSMNLTKIFQQKKH